MSATLLFAGDAMSHMPQVTDALQCGGGETYDYTACFQYIRPWINDADYAVCNLETVFREDRDYSGYPAFNSPGPYAAALKDAGFDLVTTANNHCMDQGFTGLCDTLDLLDTLGLAHIGTYRTQAEHDDNMGIVLVEINGIKTAFLDYTYGTNGIPVGSEHPYAVSLFNKDYLTTLNTPDTEKLQRELTYAETLKPDITIVLIHWGVEYQNEEGAYQEELADFLIENGADLIVGGHPHVLQPTERREVVTADGTVRTGVVCYSLGNLVSAQKSPYTDVTALLQVTLAKTGDSTAEITGLSYVPCMVLIRDPGVTPRFLILDALRAIGEYERGTSDVVTPAVYQRLLDAVGHCAEILGGEYDALLKRYMVLTSS
jgi:poly-gamma-glutamate synthesis protein (capsule biosynthesis protein)